MALIAGLFAGTAPADGKNTAGSSRAAGKDRSGEEQKTTADQGRISERQIETVTKRAEARKQRDEKMKIRAKNLRKPPRDNSSLFRSSK